MNYITRLQEELTNERARLAATRDAIGNLRLHLQGEKFQGYEADGSRRDWIATGDVWRWSELILAALD